MSTSIQYGLPKAIGVQMTTQNTYIGTNNFKVDASGHLIGIEHGRMLVTEIIDREKPIPPFDEAGQKQGNLPCPFCGSTNSTTQRRYSDMRHQMLVNVVCQQCEAKGPEAIWRQQDTLNSAVEQAYANWNRRTAAPQESA